MSVLWRGTLATRLRVASGLVLFVYVLLHFLNVGTALISVDFANSMQDVRTAITRSGPGTIVIYGALLVHFGLALAKTAQLNTLRQPPSTWLQITLGLAIPIFLIPHVIFTRGSHQQFATNDEIGYIAGLIWNTPDGWKQAGLLLIVWIHGCIGVHHWLKLTSWWRRWTPTLAGLAVFVPAFALAGFMTEARRVQAALADPETWESVRNAYNWPDGAAFTDMIAQSASVQQVFYGMLGAAVAAVVVRRLLSIRRQVRIRYLLGPEVTSAKGSTLLDISREHGIPHAALCGGRGRCTTCRVIIEEGAEHLHPPSEAEAKSLAAVNAPPGARLACQVKPTHPITVFRVFRPDGKRDRAHASQGQEARFAVLFLDIRSFTARTAGQSPYDIVFLLNRFFDAMVPHVTSAGGDVDKYLGDGFLAVFEHPTEQRSAQAALQAAEGIGKALIPFNAALRAEGSEPVRIGMGLHLGDLVIGEIGTTGNAPRTIIGDTVNAASRLESETKAHGVEAFVSEPLLNAAGYDTGAQPFLSLNLRGRDTPLQALAVLHAADLKATLAAHPDTNVPDPRPAPAE